MNLDPLTMSITQLTYLINNVTRKTLKETRTEINKIIDDFGYEAERHAHRTFISKIDFSGLKAKDIFGSYMCDEMINIFKRPNFATVICYIIESPIKESKNGHLQPSQLLYTQASLYEQLRDTLDLGSMHLLVVAMVLAKYTSNAETRKHADHYMRHNLQDTVTQYMKTGKIDLDICSDQVFSFFFESLFSGRDQLGLENHNAFIEKLVHDERLSENRRAIITPLLAYNPDKEYPVIDCDIPDSVFETSLLACVTEIGSKLTSSRVECAKTLKALGVKEITPTSVAKLFMVILKSAEGTTNSTGDVQIGLQIFNSCIPNIWSETETEGTTINPWHMDVLSHAINDVLPSLPWKKVVEKLDDPMFSLINKRQLRMLMEGLKTGLRKEPFPLDVLTGCWANTIGQVQWFALLLKHPDIFMQADIKGNQVNLECLKTQPSEDNKDVNIWKCLDIVGALLRLSNDGHYKSISEIFKIAVHHAPEILLLSLLQLRTWNSLKVELLEGLLPLFVDSHVNSNSLLSFMWKMTTHMISHRQLVVNAMMNWYAEGDPFDQVRLERILTLAQDLKSISTFLEHERIEAVLDLACLAYRRQFLKLDMWLKEKIKSSSGGEPFAMACADFIAKRFKDISMYKNKDQMPIKNTINTILTSIHGNWSDILNDKIRRLAQVHSVVLKLHPISKVPYSPTKNPEQMPASLIGQMKEMNFNSPHASEINTATNNTAESLVNVFPSINVQKVFPEDIESEANCYFQRIYNSPSEDTLTCPEMLEKLQKFKDSTVPKERDVFSVMMRNLFEEYRFFPQYPDRELRITAELFGGIIQRSLVAYMDLGIALRYVMEALKKEPSNKMYYFGIIALDSFKERLKDYPQYCHFLSMITHFPEFPKHISEYVKAGVNSDVPTGTPSAPIPIRPTSPTNKPEINEDFNRIADAVLSANEDHSGPAKPHSGPAPGLSSSSAVAPAGSDAPVDLLSAVTSGLQNRGNHSTETTNAENTSNTARSAPATTAPARTSVPSVFSKQSIANATNIDTLLAGSAESTGVAGNDLQVPPEILQDKVFFIFNNLSFSNIELKSNNLVEQVPDAYFRWVAQYLVMKRASIEHNFHSLYAALIDHIGRASFLYNVISETFRNIKVLLRSDKVIANFSDRSLLKNLGHWIGLLTLHKNKPILFTDIDVKSLLYEAYHKGHQELLYVVPFVAKIMEACAKSKVFHPPNPWTMGIMKALVELHHDADLKLNLKFEIEVLCKNLGIDINELVPSHNLHDNEFISSLEQQLGVITPDSDEEEQQPLPPIPTSSSVAEVTEAKYGYDEIDVTTYTSLYEHIELCANLPLLVTNPKLKNIIPICIEAAIKDLLPLVVDHSIKNALTTSEMIIKKDFALDPSEIRMCTAAHNMLKFMTSGMTLITCHEPMLSAVTNQLRSSFAKALGNPPIKDAIDMTAATIATENVDLCCAFVQKHAISIAIPEMDKRLQDEYDVRKIARLENRRYCDPAVLTYQAERMPEQIRLKVGGVTSQQIAVYDEFARSIPGFMPGSSNVAMHQVSMDAPSQLAQHSNINQAKLKINTNADDLIAIYDRLINEIDTVVRSLVATYHTQPPSMSLLHNLFQAIQSARGSQQETVSALLLLQKVVENLLENYTIAILQKAQASQGEVAVIYAFRDCHLLVLKGIADSRGFGLGWASKQVTRVLMECRHDIRHNIDAVECLIRSNFVVIQQYDAHLSHMLDGVIASGLSLASSGNPSSGPTSAPAAPSQPPPSSASQTPLQPVSPTSAASTAGPASTTASTPSSTATTAGGNGPAPGAISPGGSQSSQGTTASQPAPQSTTTTASGAAAGTTPPAFSQMHHNFAAVSFAMQIVVRSLNLKPSGDLEFYSTVDALVRIHLSRLPNMPEGLPALIENLRLNSFNRVADSQHVNLNNNPMMMTGISQAREIDDPSGLHEKTEFLLREWVSMYHSPAAGRDSNKAFSAFVGQMHQQGILKTDDLITRFFRLCTEMCVSISYRALMESSNQNCNIARVKCFHTLDAFVRLIALLVKHSGDTNNVVTKINLLNKVLGIVAGVLIQDHEVKNTDFQQLPYHRTFIMLFVELNGNEQVLDTINFQVLTAFCNTFHILRPSKASGFCFAWLEMISHRMFIQRILASTSQQKGWSMYAQLLIDLFKFLAPFLRNADLDKPVQMLYKGTLRVLLVLLHDFPTFLCDYHYAFCDVIPSNCIQMRNLVLSAFPRTMRLPDPFTPNLKVDILSDIVNPPRIMTDFAIMIKPNSFREHLDSYLMTRSPVTFLSDMRSKLQASTVSGQQYNIELMNALALYVGTQAIKAIQMTQCTQISLKSIAHSSHMDIFQNLIVDLDTEGRYLFINAIANQLRYPNNHTHYFSCTLLYLFSEANTEAIQEQITRVLLERLIVNRPHPWGLLITFIELIKNQAFNFWNHEFVHCAPEIKKLFESVARSCSASNAKKPSDLDSAPSPATTTTTTAAPSSTSGPASSTPTTTPLSLSGVTPPTGAESALISPSAAAGVANPTSTTNTATTAAPPTEATSALSAKA